LEGHTDYVLSVVFSPDGKLLASGSPDETVKLWRVSDGELIHTLEGHTDYVLSVTFAPDGTRLASGSGDGTIRLWGIPEEEEVIQVKTDGTGDYPTLAEAIHSAPEGGTIRLDPGVYRLAEPLVIDKPIHLLGAGMDQTEIVSDGEDYVVRFSGDGPFIVEDITFRHEGDMVADVVVVDGGEISFTRCRFTGAVQPILGESAGLRLKGDTMGTVRECLADGNDSTGIRVEDQAEPTLEENKAMNNTEVGIAYFDESGGVARRNECISNGFHGIGVGERARPTLEENMCTGNEQSGITYFGSASGMARGNWCSDNGKHGIYVGEQAQPTLEENICTNNEQAGIAYVDESDGVARGNECSGNLVGIFVDERADPSLIDNDCHGNTRADILDLRERGQSGSQVRRSTRGGAERSPSPAWTLTPPSSLVVVNVRALNVRRGPSMVYERIEVVHAGDRLQVTGQAYDCAWLRVITPSGACIDWGDG